MLALLVKVPGSDDVAPSTFRLRKIRNPFAELQYSADHGFHGLLPHSSAGGVRQQKYSINRLYDKYIT